MADLHLTARSGPNGEQDYSLAVLAEIFQRAAERQIDFMLIAGDLFDTTEDAIALNPEIRKMSAELMFPVYWIPGNHDYSRPGKLHSYDWGGLTLIEQQGWRSLEIRDHNIDLLSLPDGCNPSETPAHAVTPGQLRLAMAHGIVAGMAYNGPSEEEGGAPLDPQFFIKQQVHYAALGHIHGGRMEWRNASGSGGTQVGGGSYQAAGLNGNGTLFVYPGSSRVWRKGESGPRCIVHVSAKLKSDIQLRAEMIPLDCAGQFRQLSIPLDLQGGLPDYLPATFENFQNSDRVDAHLSGLVEDQKQLQDTVRALNEQANGKVRRLEINTDEVLVLDGVSQEPMVKRFLNLWEQKKAQSSVNEAEWLRARELGLLALKKHLEGGAL
ncbi:MAG: metallophosphoesterase [Leptospiraceae bacterium]|nr:metallophosphoesterase [Leptospiraceae bacterium]